MTDGWISPATGPGRTGFPTSPSRPPWTTGQAGNEDAAVQQGEDHSRAYRHTYAQRHADAGVDVTVLQELMDHRQVTTTQGTTASAPGGAARPSTG